MKLAVPFIPDQVYTDFLQTIAHHIESVYFSLYSGPVLDSRMRFTKISVKEFSEKLSGTSGVKKYILLNTRFIHPDLYHDDNFLNQTLDMIETLVTGCRISGIVFSDAYFLNALSATKRDITTMLEAVPSVNCMIDNYNKALSFIRLIEQTGFRLPGKLILDRGLNRCPQDLAETAGIIKTKFPAMKIELLANEGCIYQCPFKPVHDAQISFFNLKLSRDKSFKINHSLGCHPWFFNHPENFFKSPFIRPEDISCYENIADAIKICGRTHGPGFLMRCINAYISRSYDGNLLDLMDAARWLGDIYHIDNKMLGSDFFNIMTTCTKDCKNCKICHKLFLKAGITKPVEIRQYKEFL